MYDTDLYLRKCHHAMSSECHSSCFRPIRSTDQEVRMHPVVKAIESVARIQGRRISGEEFDQLARERGYVPSEIVERLETTLNTALRVIHSQEQGIAGVLDRLGKIREKLQKAK